MTDTHFYGKLSSWDVLVKSSNIGMSMLAERMGNAKVREALAAFEFGRRSGIELPGEDDVLRKVFEDLKGAGVQISEGEVRMKMAELLAQARESVRAGN